MNDGNPLPSGESGEIVVRGPAVFAGYADNQEANHDRLSTDGSVPETKASWTRTAICTLRAESRRSSFAAGRKFRRAKSRS